MSTKGHGAKRPRKTEAAIAALLNLPTVDAAARSLGIGEATLRRWMKEPSFRAAYQTARREAVQEASARLQQAGSTAVATLVEIMQNAKASDGARVSAARTVLEMGQRSVELDDLAGRMAAIERELARWKSAAEKHAGDAGTAIPIRAGGR